MGVLIKFGLLLVAIAMVTSQRARDLPRDMPPDMPWIPQWLSCEFDYETYQNGPSCNNCSSTIQCTPVGGIVRNCFGWTPYCMYGMCSHVPSKDCVEVN